MEVPQSTQENTSETEIQDFKSIWQSLVIFLKNYSI